MNIKTHPNRSATMSQSKRKVFTFDEDDLEWINPMLLEWEKENEGKKQGELVTALLKDYRESRKPLGFDLQSTMEKIRIHTDRFRSALSSSTETFRSKLRDFLDQMKSKAHDIKVKLEEHLKTTMEKIQTLIASRRKMQ